MASKVLCFLSLFILVSLVMSNFRVSTLNLNGARDIRKGVRVYELMKLKHINVLMVQETHSDCSNVTDWNRDWEGEVILSHLSRACGGVRLLFSKDFLLSTRLL